MSNPERWLVLGASSWLGYLLLSQEAANVAAGTMLSGTIHRQHPAGLPDCVGLNVVKEGRDYLQLLESFQPTIVVNFLRGEDEPGLALHADLAAHCRRAQVLYVYASSVLALDGYGGAGPLAEDLPPRSTSTYGRFKGQCEISLRKSGGEWLVLRFASVQGWVPHKPTRNEKFLSRLARGEPVPVDTGIVQNRLTADLLVEAVRVLARDRVTGVVHLGATDASDEIDFLRAEAAEFGWNPRQVVPGPEKPANLYCQPGRIIQLYGDRFQRREADTLAALARHPGLQRWRKFN